MAGSVGRLLLQEKFQGLGTGLGPRVARAGCNAPRHRRPLSASDWLERAVGDSAILGVSALRVFTAFAGQENLAVLQSCRAGESKTVVWRIDSEGMKIN